MLHAGARLSFSQPTTTGDGTSAISEATSGGLAYCKICIRSHGIIRSSSDLTSQCVDSESEESYRETPVFLGNTEHRAEVEEDCSREKKHAAQQHRYDEYY